MLSAYQTDVWELADPESYLCEHRDKRVILDEIKRAPDRIAARRGLIDEKRHKAEERGNSGKMMDSQKPDLPVSVKHLGKKIGKLQLRSWASWRRP
jgi:hypothetical protein